MLVWVRHLRVDYEAVTAVRDLSFEFDAGTIYGLIGPNGAGKTTTIRALATLLEPVSGQVQLDGVDAIDQPERAHRVLGYMPDGSTLFDDLTVTETLHVFASAYKLPVQDRPKVIDQVLDLVDLRSKWNWYVSTLSKGMRQRCLLAKTLLHDPKVLLLDEPANGLDPMARIELREVLKSLASMGKAILISSHILTELSDFCTAIGIMERGAMVRSGSTREIAQQLEPGMCFRVELLEQDPRAEKLVRAQPWVRSVEAGERHVEFRMEGADDAAAADLLRSLIQEGVKVRTFTEKKMNLEDIFMRIGAREVS